MYNLRLQSCSTMASWTPDHSTVLSALLDEAIGTNEMIETRQDYCRIHDCLRLNFFGEGDGIYFTGSKAEGLDLPGSDKDYMWDMNKELNIKVIQSLDMLDEKSRISSEPIHFMCCNNVPPGFTLLQKVHPTPECPDHGTSQSSICQTRAYADGDVQVDTFFSLFRRIDMIKSAKRQGPSVEVWTEDEDLSESGTDYVMSIKCQFWPDQALDWVQRQRYFRWPSSNDISSITDFGFHLVAVGHPYSELKLHEYRISFSLAERTLVWSFNHTQMQCYALMKIILKEFIKVKCNPQNQVLCSYFIKTFLFWKYETTEMNFWRADNLRECLRYLLVGFSACIREGILRHYFIPRFNLLSVKLTRAAQTELLQLFDVIIQSDTCILKECKTLTKIWSMFLQEKDNKNNVISRLRKTNMLRNDECMMKFIVEMFCNHSVVDNSHSLSKAIQFGQRLALSNKTPLQALAFRKFFSEMHITGLRHLPQSSGNKGVYQILHTAQTDTGSFDISTCNLWCAILLYMKGEFSSALNIINQVLSDIPPFAMHHCDCKGSINETNESKQLYVDMYLDSDTSIVKRVRKAWTCQLHFTRDMADLVPLAIRIELYFENSCIWLSQFTIVYYLQFLCYHGMGQYLNRDRALQEINDSLENKVECSCIRHSVNILGHCLLVTGRKYQAREIFLLNAYLRSSRKNNSAPWYLQNFF